MEIKVVETLPCIIMGYTSFTPPHTSIYEFFDGIDIEPNSKNMKFRVSCDWLELAWMVVMYLSQKGVVGFVIIGIG